MSSEPNPLPDGEMSVLAKIAADELGVETLDTRNSDSLDFYDIAVWQLKAVLAAAYRAGASKRIAGAPR